ncbi:FapA family protein [Alicyclobacillus fastidiosus]|uniref:FapA family protein n=1 Tax=Alicyclobacillus fastidiosus TaxID=392011 RepID=A0ABV5AI61_9BACL|nr:FapA family protein [Alicyclobacillus fastidiosus]WEH10097.1 FapA family protein [Alicyclobacillus fastidiosus]
MLGVIVTRGKTIDDAIHKAAQQLNVSEDAIEYEVVSKGSRRLFMSRSAVIQATVKKQTPKDMTPTDEISSESIHENYVASPEAEKHASEASTSDKDVSTEGLAWVKNGQISCKNGIYHYALLTPCNGVVLLVNGQSVSGTTVITEDDVIDVKLQHEHFESKMNLTISPDKMKVILEIIPGYWMFRHLKDKSPSRELSLEVTESKQVKNDMTELSIYKELEKLGVRFGFDKNQIKLACTANEPAKFIVAQGIQPIFGQDGMFELVSKKRNEQKDLFSLSEHIDWKERFSLPSVKAGEVIGHRIPARPGVNGKNVFNEEVAAPQVRELTIVTEEGTALHSSKQSVIATTAGRIKVQQRPNNALSFRVLPQYVHNGDVNVESGNIRFRGDVYILGNVDEGMTVESGGNLHITGMVTNATVITGGDVVINGSVIGTDIICGHTHLFWDRMLPTFKFIHQDLTKVIGAARQLEKNQAFTRADIASKGLQPLIKLLTEIKFKDLPIKIREISEPVKRQKESFGPDVSRIVDFLEKAFHYFHPHVAELKQLESLAEFMASVIASIEYDANKKMNIQVKSLTNSSIKSAWNVVVERLCYGSNIYCKGGVQVRGILRGGSVHAGDFIESKEIGSSGGSRTEVQVVNERGYIAAELIGTDTTVRISGAAKKLISAETSVRARLNTLGDLVLR